MRLTLHLAITCYRKAIPVLGGAVVMTAWPIVSSVVGAEKSAAQPNAAASVQRIDFNRDIAPIFQASCVACHAPEKPQGRLRLDSEAAVLQGGVSGKIVIPWQSNESLLLKRLSGSGDAPRM